ncbi:hypothetical protein F7725_008737 [Dissostichus mawsoni]|uniref:Uncharacterized protein n=1 Tax=Dissostichus mawsoni TaxID=36200 RepID=A0A7J5Y810_DISMA|nr:hypothetical protein F7725_008737 [Dissostichus mawsoni]
MKEFGLLDAGRQTLIEPPENCCDDRNPYEDFGEYEELMELKSPRSMEILSTVGGVGARADWLIAEQVFAVQRAAEFLQEAQHVVDAVHHREAEQVLLPVKPLGEQREDGFLQEGAVDAALHGLLEHHGGSVRTKVIRQLEDLLPVQVRTRVGLLVDVDADWSRETQGKGVT